MSTIRRLGIVLVIMSCVIVVAAGCAASRTVRPSAEVPAPPGAGGERFAESKTGGGVRSTGLDESAVPAEYANEQMIIRTGSLSLIVTDTAAAMDDIKAIAEGVDGYVATSNAYYSGEWLRGSMQVRVPAGQFDSAIDQFKALATRVENQSTGSQDVTEEYTDLSARLRNLEATEAELLELLATVVQRTGKAEDILAVHREITDIRQQIEQLKGRMQYLERMTAFATIDIELIPDQLGEPITQPTWEPSITLRNAWRALRGALQGLVDALIWFAVFVLPILLAVAIPVGFVIWLIRTLVRRRKGAP